MVLTDDEIVALAAGASSVWPASMPTLPAWKHDQQSGWDSSTDPALVAAVLRGYRSLSVRRLVDGTATASGELGELVEHVLGATRRVGVALVDSELTRIPGSLSTVFHIGARGPHGHGCLMEMIQPNGTHSFELLDPAATPGVIDAFSASSDGGPQGGDPSPRTGEWACFQYLDGTGVGVVGMSPGRAFLGTADETGAVHRGRDVSTDEARSLLVSLLGEAPGPGRLVVDSLTMPVPAWLAASGLRGSGAHRQAMGLAPRTIDTATVAELVEEGDLPLADLSTEQVQALWLEERLQVDPAAREELEAATRTLVACGLAWAEDSELALSGALGVVRQCSVVDPPVRVVAADGTSMELTPIGPDVVLEHRASSAGLHSYVLRPGRAAVSDLVSSLLGAVSAGPSDPGMSWPVTDDDALAAAAEHLGRFDEAVHVVLRSGEPVAEHLVVLSDEHTGCRIATFDGVHVRLDPVDRSGLRKRVRPALWPGRA